MKTLCIMTLLISLFTTCKSQIDVNEYEQYVIEIVEFLLEHREKGNTKKIGDSESSCYLINPKMHLDTRSCAYRFFNQTFRKKSLYENDKTWSLYMGVSNVRLDTTGMDLLIGKEYLLKSLPNYDKCVTFTDSKTNERPEGALTFSMPLPTTNNDVFIIWVASEVKRHDDHEWIYIIKKKGSEFIILNEHYDDYCGIPH